MKTGKSQTTKRKKLDWEKVGELPYLHWGEERTEKEEHKSQQTDIVKDLPLQDKCWDGAVTLDFIQGKRVRQEIVDDQFDSSKTLHTHTSSQTAVHHAYITDRSVFYPNSNRGHAGGFVSYPGAKMHPYPSASWESVWDFHKKLDQHALKASVNTCKVIRLPLLAQRQKPDFNGFGAPLHFPPVLRQEIVFLRETEFLHSYHRNCCGHQLPHPGFLATSYLGP